MQWSRLLRSTCTRNQSCTHSFEPVISPEKTWKRFLIRKRFSHAGNQLERICPLAENISKTIILFQFDSTENEQKPESAAINRMAHFVHFGQQFRDSMHYWSIILPGTSAPLQCKYILFLLLCIWKWQTNSMCK